MSQYHPSLRKGLAVVAAVAASMLLSACAAKHQEPVNNTPAYEISGKVQKVREYNDKAAGKYWGAAVKVFEQTAAGEAADGKFEHFGTLRRYKLTAEDAARLKRGMKITATEHTDMDQSKDYYHRDYLHNINVQ